MDPNLEVLAGWAGAIREVDMGDADVEEDKDEADEEDSEDEDQEEASDESEEDEEMESEDDDDEIDSEEDEEMESEEEEVSESEEAPTADAGEVMDQLVEMFRSENGRDPNEKELVRWIKTLRDAGNGPISFEDDESDGDRTNRTNPNPNPSRTSPRLRRRRRRRNACPSARRVLGEEGKGKDDKDFRPVRNARRGFIVKEVHGRQARVLLQEGSEGCGSTWIRNAPRSKKAKAAPAWRREGWTEKAAPAAEFIASKKFTGAKPGYYFKKGPKGVGYYVDKNAPRSKKSSAAETPAKKSSVFSIPREQADFQPAKKFAGAKKGFVFKKGPKGLGYYLDRPPKVMHRPGSARGGQRGIGRGAAAAAAVRRRAGDDDDGQRLGFGDSGVRFARGNCKTRYP